MSVVPQEKEKDHLISEAVGKWFEMLVIGHALHLATAHLRLGPGHLAIELRRLVQDHLDIERHLQNSGREKARRHQGDDLEIELRQHGSGRGSELRHLG